MRPGITETKSYGSFLSGDFGWGFDYGAYRITHLAGVFQVGMVDAPELIPWLLC